MITSDKEYRAYSHIVGDWLLYYHGRKREYTDRLNEYTDSAGVGSSTLELVPIHGSMPGDRTGTQAVKLADMLEDIESDREWLALVEDIERRLPWKMQLILRLRWQVVERDSKLKYKPTGKKRWIPYVRNRYCTAVSARQGKEYWVESTAQYKSWWAIIVKYATVEAAKRGLL